MRSMEPNLYVKSAEQDRINMTPTENVIIKTEDETGDTVYIFKQYLNDKVTTLSYHATYEGAECRKKELNEKRKL